MSGVAIIRALLVAHAPLVAMVAADRIKAGVLPLGTTLPAIGITQVSGVDRNIISPRATVTVTERVQVTVLAATYVQQKAVIALVRKACRDQRGTFASYPACLVLTYGQGPDGLLGDGSGVFDQAQDFSVSYAQTP